MQPTSAETHSINKPYPTYPPARDYLTFVLTGNAVRDKIKLDYAQLIIREIETTEELTHGVNFHFTDSAKYWSFVKALDILSQEKATHYIAEHRDIWFWADPTEEPEPMTSEVEILSKDWLLQL
jgi:hypothetical protein